VWQAGLDCSLAAPGLQ